MPMIIEGKYIVTAEYESETLYGLMEQPWFTNELNLESAILEFDACHCIEVAKSRGYGDIVVHYLAVGDKLTEAELKVLFRRSIITKHALTTEEVAILSSA